MTNLGIPILIYHFFTFWGLNSVSTEFIPDSDFKAHYLTAPKVYHGVQKREVLSSKETEENFKHIDHLTVKIDLCGQERVLDLQLNRDLIPQNYFEKHQVNDEYVVRRPKLEELELCHYNGNIRGIKNSWVAVSTCNGLRGTLFDGSEVFYIENTVRNSWNSLTDPHVIYKHNDLRSNFTCGFQDTPAHLVKQVTDNAKSHRIKRNAEIIHGPYNSNRLSRYIELVLVVDTLEYKHLNEDITRVHQHCKDLANIINSLYVPLNIFVALVGIVIWSNADEIKLVPNGDTTLTHFLNYRKEKLVKEHPNDNAQLLTYFQFEGGVVGKALKGPICTFEFSGGVNTDHSDNIGLVANTIAHEMGHNLGMEHDTEGTTCICPEEKCIMAPSSGSYKPAGWSSCSREYLAIAFEHGMDYCLRNKPTSLFDSPVCGNGFVEPGEQCDCGLKDICDNPCCDASTCTLLPNATCATGECCDFATCQPHTAGTVCRRTEHECDLPEYCNGNSEYCPEDVFKIDGEVCNNGMAFCYHGNCRSHNDQCRTLWGPSGSNSATECYKHNLKGDFHGNCGYNKLNKSYVKCNTRNVLCGMLQCKHYNERLEFGMETASIQSHTFVNGNDTNLIACRTVVVDMGLNDVDPGLVPDGAKCDENHLCFNQRCLQVEHLRAITVPNACPKNCNGNGICNSKGHCHCYNGFDPPYCDGSGYGGSLDSGPAENPQNRSTLRKVFVFLMFTCGLIALLLFVYSYYIRKSPSYFWKRNQRRIIQKSVQIHVSRDDSGMANSTLLSNNLTTEKPADNSKSSLRDSLIGHFKGFNITPLSNTGGSNDPPKSVPIRSAPPPGGTLNPCVISSNSIISSANVVKSCTNNNITPPLPPSNAGVLNRPLISSPVLDNTTSSTVKMLIDKNLPVRPAPAPPKLNVKSERPNSTACILDKNERTLRFLERCSTLNRAPSLISKSQNAKNEKRESVPLKAAKIDRDTLKNLVISNPIPLNEPNIPVDPLPLSEDQHKSALRRAQSLRRDGNKRLGVQPLFGSLRYSNSIRPTSISFRPKSPPPCPPLPSIRTCPVPPQSKSNSTMYTNLTGVLDQSEDNIYAVIEESPPEEMNSPLREPLAGADSDSGSLLSEIVTEIQARNLHSVYSMDSKNVNVPSKISNSPLTNATNLYENTTWHHSTTSSEYLNPINCDKTATTEMVKKPNSLKVPEKSAPTYKPFNLSKKSTTPITSMAKNRFLNNDKKVSEKATSSSSQNSSQNSKISSGNVKSSVASMMSKFDAADISKDATSVGKIVGSKNNASNVTRSNVQKNVGASFSNVNSARISNVALIQKKFESQSKFS